MGWSEDRLHRHLARLPRPRALAGTRGHDAAVLRPHAGLDVACLDQCVEGVHFERDADPRAVGAKAAGRALSDLAATAARPRAVLLGLCAPRERTDAWLRAAIAGVRAAARAAGADLLGGDLCAAPGPARLDVTALGTYGGRGPAPGRARARAGQRVLVTGPLGGSLLGRHLAVRPRVEIGVALHACGATALMDVSDGLAWDLFRLARAAGVAIELELKHVPVHPDARRRARTSGRTPLDHALHDGEDHELIATLAPRAVARARRTVAALPVRERRGGACVEIGRVVPGSGLVLIDDRGRRTRWRPTQGGFRHGE